MRQFDVMMRGRSVEGTEIVEARALDAKLFDLGGGRKRLVKCLTPIHYDTGAGLDDIDLAPVLVGNEWVVDKAPYVLRIGKNKPTVSYEGRVSGRVVSLSHSGNVSVSFVGDRARWDAISTEKNVTLHIRPASIAAETWLLGGNANFADEWAVLDQGVGGDDTGGADPLSGADAANHPAEIIDGAFTGRVSKIVDEETRQRDWVADPVWPVRLV